MAATARFLKLAFIALLLSLFDGRSAQAPPEPVTRFRAVEGYSLFITVRSDDAMKVEFQGESSWHYDAICRAGSLRCEISA